MDALLLLLAAAAFAAGCVASEGSGWGAQDLEYDAVGALNLHDDEEFAVSRPAQIQQQQQQPPPQQQSPGQQQQQQQSSQLPPLGSYGSSSSGAAAAPAGPVGQDAAGGR